MDCDCCYRNSCGNFCSMCGRNVGNKGKIAWKTPEELLVEYMDHIPKQEYEEMYAMLHIEASGNVSQEDFVTRNSAIYEGIEVQNIAVQIIAYDEEQMTVTYQTSFDTVAGTISFENKALFLKDEEGYQLVWDDSLIFPNLASTDKVRVSTTQAERGEILDRNGRVLAGKGTASSVGIVPGKLENREEAIAQIAELVEITPEAIEKKLSAKWVKDDSFVPIKTIPRVEGIELMSISPDEEVLKEKERHEKLLEKAKKSGYVRVRIDGNLYELSEEISLDKNIKHNIEIIVDRLVVREGIQKRLTDSIESVLALAEGLLVVDVIGGEPLNFSQSFSCPDCGISIEEIEPSKFFFNNPFGACPVCFGLGYKMEFDVDLMIPDQSLSIDEGAIVVMGWQSCTDKGSYTRAILKALCKEYNFSLDTPFQDYPQEVKDILIHGTNGREVKVYYKGQRGEGIYDVAFEGNYKK